MNKLSYRSISFPSSPPLTNGILNISKSKLCWAAITVGRPGKAAVKSFGDYSVNEALYRWNMVRASIDMTAAGGHFVNSDLFNALDPTEKGGVNFYLGMIFAKIAAQDLLSIPWLVHFHWMSQNHAVPLTAGSSSPDLLGLSPVTNLWSVFEAKGRNATYSSALMTKAKTQANNLTTVDGQNCERYVGTQLYRNSTKQLKFTWEDPEPDDEHPIFLKTNRHMWLRYYGVAHAIYERQRTVALSSSEQLGFKIDFAPEALKLIDALKTPRRPFRKQLKKLCEWSSEYLKQPSEGWSGDGIQISMDRD